MFGPAGLLFFGALDAGVGLADHIRKVVKHKKEIRLQNAQLKTNGFEQHFATRNGPLWHYNTRSSRDLYQETQRNYISSATAIDGAVTRAPSSATSSVSHSEGSEYRQTPAWHYAFSDVKKRYIM